MPKPSPQRLLYPRARLPGAVPSPSPLEALSAGAVCRERGDLAHGRALSALGAALGPLASTGRITSVALFPFLRPNWGLKSKA